jgi:hypothetical protein
MMGKHLTEQEIQLYATEATACSSQIVEHTQACEYCKTQASIYQQLFTGIKESPRPVFEFDLANLVINNLPLAKKKYQFPNFPIYLLAIGALAMAGSWFKHSLLNMFSGMFPMTIYLLVLSAVIILIFQGLDMYRKYQKILNTVS